MAKSTSTAVHKPQRYRHRRTVVEGIIYDGTVEGARAIVAWGRKRTGNTPFRIEMDDLVADTPQGPRYVPENWLAVLGVIGEPYSIQPAVLAVAYDVVPNDPDYRAPLTLERVRELAAEAASADLLRVRDIVAQLAFHCETVG